MQRDASAFGRLPSAKGAWRALVPSVAELAPSADEADHRQVARAIAANARYFVTRDGELLKATQSVQERLGMLVTRPEDLIVHLDRLRYSGGYEPQALQATSISRIDIDRLEQSDLVAAFLHYGAGERASRLQELLRPALAAPRDHGFHVFRDADGRLLGVLILAAGREHLEVKLMRVSTGGKLAGAVARQLAFLPRREAAERRLGRVLVTDPAPPEAVSEPLRDECTRAEYDAYFDGTADAVAIALTAVRRLPPARAASRASTGTRVVSPPPQSFRYLSSEQTASLGVL